MGRYYYDKNSITNSTCDVICHQVNCRGAMNSGVAKAVREKWPEVYVNYKFWCDANAAEDLANFLPAFADCFCNASRLAGSVS